MTKYGHTRSSLAKHSLAPKKRFGQNFLVNQKTAERIARAAGVTDQDTIVEVGVGLGALTQPLAEKAARVIGLEIDSGLIRFHEEEGDLPANVELRHLDVLKADFGELVESCGGPLKIVANLPYSISNPFIFTLIENRRRVESAVIMVQKEVADRLMAEADTKDYGIPSVMLQSCADISRLLTLKPAEFHPRPKIDSTVVRIHFNHDTLVSLQGQPYQFRLCQKIVRTTFNQRRKTIANTLTSASFFEGAPSVDKSTNRELTLEAISVSGLAPTCRPEVLQVNDFIVLTLAFERVQKRVGVTD